MTKWLPLRALRHIVFPGQIYAEFSQALLPTFDALIDYAQAFSMTSHDVLVEKRRQIEVVLSSDTYPGWVYATGFNPGLRAGFRFFLVYLERVTEVFFSLDYWLNREIDVALITELSGDMTGVMQRNMELLVVLRDFFATGVLAQQYSDVDYTGDMVLLEQALSQCVPANLDLLDVSADYVAVTAIVRDLKDIRELLLQLALTLPVNN